jgi:hypothetical protein
MSGGAPVRSAERLLVTAVGPARSPGLEYEPTARPTRLGLSRRLKSPGEGAAILEAIAGELTIRSSRARAMKAWTLDVTGRRREPVPLAVDSGAVVLKLQPEHRSVYYELAVE